MFNRYLVLKLKIFFDLWRILLVLIIIYTENDIDGESLLMLIDDFDEFRCLVEAPLARLKMKKFVKERASNTSAAEKGQPSKV